MNENLQSFFTHLECTYCPQKFKKDVINRLCKSCGKVLFAKYDLEKASKVISPDKIKTRPPNMWRYFEVMPVIDPKNVVSLGEGYTPILKCTDLGNEIGIQDLLIKDEGLNPTASFKARGLSAAVSKAKELGVKAITMPSAGNAAGAMSSYAARASIDSYVFMPKDAPFANKEEALMTGATVELVDGLISDAGVISREKAQQNNWFDVSTLQEPYRVEGKKTMGYEIAEQLNWKIPDVIIYPTGGGTGIVGIWKAFEEMQAMGWIDSKRPKMYAVQAEGCAPIVRAYLNNDEFAEPWANANTYASGIRVPSAIGDYLILDALRKSNGGALTVSDQEMRDMTQVVSELEGLFVCPEGAATAVALKKLVSLNQIKSDDQVLLLNTGSGLKYLEYK
ncbi:MAG: threonine synthase [Chloroflexi bacterium]|nr:MAG: threonine synthase [SAR202 cluster bacterium]MBA14500.1 threonine synthase [Chloroflexota bacterium]|tara:strand:- start:1968 stop:3146 length:1179 start_codon:yes stop_codon:yes gene_type:complete